jgi:hypothetical protein
MPLYLIYNRIFEDISKHKLEAENDAEAIKTFKRRYKSGTDDGGWRLVLADNPDKIIASTESSDMKTETTVNYMTYA